MWMWMRCMSSCIKISDCDWSEEMRWNVSNIKLTLCTINIIFFFYIFIRSSQFIFLFLFIGLLCAHTHAHNQPREWEIAIKFHPTFTIHHMEKYQYSMRWWWKVKATNCRNCLNMHVVYDESVCAGASVCVCVSTCHFSFTHNSLPFLPNTRNAYICGVKA